LLPSDRRLSVRRRTYRSVLCVAIQHLVEHYRVWASPRLPSASHNLFVAALNSQRVQCFVFLVGGLVLHLIQHSRVIHYSGSSSRQNVHIALVCAASATPVAALFPPIHLHHARSSRARQSLRLALFVAGSAASLSRFRPNLHRINCADSRFRS
jgi:hypothetical protein